MDFLSGGTKKVVVSGGSTAVANSDTTPLRETENPSSLFCCICHRLLSVISDGWRR